MATTLGALYFYACLALYTMNHPSHFFSTLLTPLSNVTSTLASFRDWVTVICRLQSRFCSAFDISPGGRVRRLGYELSLRVLYLLSATRRSLEMRCFPESRRIDVCQAIFWLKPVSDVWTLFSSIFPTDISKLIPTILRLHHLSTLYIKDAAGSATTHFSTLPHSIALFFCSVYNLDPLISHPRWQPLQQPK